MKKIIILALLFIVFSGCKKAPTEDEFFVELSEKMEEITKYEVDAKMSLKKEEGSISFDINVLYLNPDYYKVTLKNNNNDNIQVIIKNDTGTYVINPALNKSFKFDGSWPLNSSQGYLIQSIYKDILNDETKTFNLENENVVIEHNITHKVHSNWTRQKVVFDVDTLMPKEVSIKDTTDKEVVKITFQKFNFDKNIKKEEFDVEEANESVRSSLTENVFLEQEFKEVTFIPDGVSVLHEAEQITDDIVIATFSGEYNYTIVGKFVEEEKVLGCNYLYSDIIYLDEGIGLIGESVLTWYVGGVEYNIYSSDLNYSVMQEIANSLN